MVAWKRHTVRSGFPEADADEAFENVRREISFRRGNYSRGTTRSSIGEIEKLEAAWTVHLGHMHFRAVSFV